MFKRDNTVSDRVGRIGMADSGAYRRCMASRRICTTLGAAVASEPASKKKKGLPPGATTKQIQPWIEDYCLRNTLCTYDGCTRSFTWGK